MTLTLLLDLDDTLLATNLDSFLPAYLGALGRYMAAYVDADRLVKTLLAATDQMVKNRLPNKTLKDVFDSVFFPRLELDEATLRSVIDRFYIEVFPTLRNVTQPRPDAVRMVDEALRRGYRVGIATNPIFPRSAIMQRVEWAGLYPAKFTLVPSYDVFHFAKPETAFYTEFMGQMGWPEGPVVMVGNDLEMDIYPARRSGLQTYLVVADENKAPADLDGIPHGAISNLLPWLDEMPPEKLQPDFSSTEAILAVLRATPAVLASLTGQFDKNSWSTRLDKNEWSLSEVLCHLRDVEADVNLPRIEHVIQETNPFLPGKDTDLWAEERQYCTQDGAGAFQAFSGTRQKMLAILDGLSAADWQRPARHAILGPTRLVELMGIAAAHDRLHIQQVYNLLTAHNKQPG